MKKQPPSHQALAAARDIEAAFELGTPPRELIATIIDRQTRFHELNNLLRALCGVLPELKFDLALPENRKELAKAMRELRAQFHPDVDKAIDRLDP